MDYSSLEQLPEFDDHRIVSCINDKKSGLKAFIAIHRGSTERPSFGATRFWHYPQDVSALRDALRLSRMMSYKAALAGLPYGGGKGVILAPKEESSRRGTILRTYAKVINYFSGRFITGTDVGLRQADVRMMKQVSPHMVGIHGDPTEFTGLGLFYGLRLCVKEMFGGNSLADRTIAIQGLGKIGAKLLELVYLEAKSVIISDIDEKRVARMLKQFPRATAVAPDRIHAQSVDIFSPCALSHSLNRDTLKELRATLIAGGANNQLEDETIGDRLYEQGVLYAPDYVINAGGLICVADEYEHTRFNAVRVAERVNIVPKTLAKIISASKRLRKAPHRIANEMAEKIFGKY